MRAAVLATLIAFSGSAHAEFFDGNKLYSRMSSTDKSDQLLALGYVMGTADSLDGVGYCAPSNVTAGQIFDMVKQYLAENPSLRARTGDAIIYRVVSTQWPCQQKAPSAVPKTNL